MDRLTGESLEARVEKLEQQNRWLRRAGLAGSLAVAGIMLMGQARPAGKVIEAECFVVKDPAGKVRAALGITPAMPSSAPVSPGETAVMLMMLDENGKVRSTLAVQKDGPAVILKNENGDHRAMMALVKGQPNLSFHDSQKLRLYLGVRADEQPGLYLYDGDSKTRAGLGLSADGHPGLNIFNKNGEVRAWLAEMSTGQPGLGLLGADGSSLFKAP